MIRFSYEPPEDVGLPYRRYAIEGDNRRGFALVGWEPRVARRKPLKQWFTTLGDALNFCAETYCIDRTQWNAPGGDAVVVTDQHEFLSTTSSDSSE
jgi:hypothetical protein